MGNTKPRVLQYTGIEDYYASYDGFIYRKLKSRPRHRHNTCTIKYDGEWYWMLNPYRRGKYCNYLAITTQSDCSKSVHRLVSLAYNFVENHNTLQVNHKDKNTFNNHIDNLEWCTNKENCIHKFSVSNNMTIDEMYNDYLYRYSEKEKDKDWYVAMPQGSWLKKYDKDLILEMLANTSLSKLEIAKSLGCSERAVKYWQEKEKIKQYDLSDVVFLFLADNPNAIPKQIADELKVRVTTVHGILRKPRFNDYRKGNGNYT